MQKNYSSSLILGVIKKEDKIKVLNFFFSAQPPTFPDFAPWLTYRPPLPLQGYLPLQNNFLASKFVSGLFLKNFYQVLL
jgi:hypothetical protein